MQHALHLAVVAPEKESKKRQEMIEALELAFAWLGQHWGMTEPKHANVLILLTNSAENSKALWEECRKTFPADRILVYGSGSPPEEARWSLDMRWGRPVIPKLVNVLLKMEESLLGYSASSEVYEPRHYIQGVIAEALADGISRVCSLPDELQTSIYILPKENACYVMDDIEKATPICSARRESLKTSIIADDELLRKVGYITFSSRLSKYAVGPDIDLFQEINFKKAKRYHLKELIWFATLVNSHGRLLSGCGQDDYILLKHWPEYTRLHCYHDYLEVAKIMSRQAFRLADMRNRTHLSMRQVIAFHNACSLLDLVARGDHAHNHAEHFAAVRSQLYELIKLHAAGQGHRIKIVVAGTVGSGKSTVISTLSDFHPITTETRPSDNVSQRKSGTTVAMDYGEARFDDMKILLYGTPGQRRFDFMGEILCQTAWALLILIDNTESNPLAELDYYLNLYRAKLPKLKVLVGITHSDTAGRLDLDDYRNHLANQGIRYPVAKLDPREYSDIVRFFREALTASH